VVANDTDVDGDSLSAAGASLSDPANGSVELITSGPDQGKVRYTPDTNYNNTAATADTFKYRASDGTANSNEVTVSVTVNQVNDAPQSANDTYSVDENNELTDAAPGVLGNDTDVENDSLTVSDANDSTPGIDPVSGASHGSVTLKADGSFTYKPSADYNGSDSFTYKANDGPADSNIATVNITVNSVNDAPVATGGTASMDEDQMAPLQIDPRTLVSDIETADANLTYTIVSGPTAQQGTLSADPNTAGLYSFDSADNYFGTVVISYKVTDRGDPDNCGAASNSCAAAKVSETKTVTVTVNAVNDAPVADNEAYSVDEDTTLDVPAPGHPGLLANDDDVENDVLHVADANADAADGISPVSGPSHGTVTLYANGSFTYKPALNYHGSDYFTYRVCDNGSPEPKCSVETATVNVTINPVNDDPTANAQSITTDEDTSKAITLTGDDVDGDTLTFSIVSGPSKGQLSGTGASLTYTPQANYNGPDSFTYKVDDGALESSVATVSITVDAVNDTPKAKNDTAEADEDTATVINVLAGDSDVDGDALSVVRGSLSDPANGSVEVITSGNDQGKILYTPDLNYNGPDSFTYRASDGTANSDPATVSVNVRAINDDPEAEDDLYATDEDTPLTINASNGVLSNDSDTDSDVLEAEVISGPTNGMLTLHPDGSFTYTPNANFNGVDSFTYKAVDPSNGEASATVTVTIHAKNDAPVAGDDPASTDEDTATVIDVLANDSDVDSANLTAAVADEPANGELTPNANGSFTYTPNANYNGSDSFTYRANDGTSNSAAATVSINIDAVNDAPSFTAGANQIVQDKAGAQSVASWATSISVGTPEESAQGLQFVVTSDNNSLFTPAGRPAVSSNGTLTYTPAVNASGTANVSVVAKDSGGTASGGDDTSYAQSFTITVNDATTPKVMVTVPTNKVTGVAPKANIMATFSEVMKPGTINGSTFVLKAGKTKILASVYVDPKNDRRWILNPSSSLARGTTYVATVTTGAQDLTGNALDQNPTRLGNQPKRWRFTVR
jgi:VCBS repeat-containing protein